jgi:hypothetical protein
VHLEGLIAERIMRSESQQCHLISARRILPQARDRQRRRHRGGMMGAVRGQLSSARAMLKVPEQKAVVAVFVGLEQQIG